MKIYNVSIDIGNEIPIIERKSLLKKWIKNNKYKYSLGLINLSLNDISYVIFVGDISEKKELILKDLGFEIDIESMVIKDIYKIIMVFAIILIIKCKPLRWILNKIFKNNDIFDFGDSEQFKKSYIF